MAQCFKCEINIAEEEVLVKCTKCANVIHRACTTIGSREIWKCDICKQDRNSEKVGRLCVFIMDLLNDSRYCPSIICWDDYEKGTFRFVQSEKVARLWGDKIKNPEMNFLKFSRAMRYYYKSKVLIAVQRRLVYQFGPKAMIRQNQALPGPTTGDNDGSSLGI